MNIVIVDCFDTWEHRVDLLYDAFINEGHVTKCLLSDFKHFDKVYRTDQKQGFKFFHAQGYKKNISINRVFSHMRLARDIFAYIDKHADEIDVLWVLAPPNVFVRYAARIKKKHKHIRLIVDLIDLWPETMPLGNIKEFLFSWKKLRDNSLQYADIIVTECNLYRDVLSKAIDKKSAETLYLARENKGYTSCLKLDKERVSLCYLGSINNIIDIDGIVRVINTCLKKRETTLHIIGDGEKKKELVRKVKATGAEIIDHGKVYDQTIKQQIFDSCHYGLNMMKDTVCVGLTMKSIDYFEYGLPIINNIKGDTWEIVEKYGCGVNVDLNGKINADSFEIGVVDNETLRIKSRAFFEEALTADVFRSRVTRIIDSIV